MKAISVRLLRLEESSCALSSSLSPDCLDRSLGSKDRSRSGGVVKLAGSDFVNAEKMTDSHFIRLQSSLFYQRLFQ